VDILEVGVEVEVPLEMEMEAEAMEQELLLFLIWVSMRLAQSIMETSKERVTGALIFTETLVLYYLNEGESIAETKNIQISSNLDAFSIRQSTASPDISTPAPTFYSRPLVTGGQQGNNMVDSFHIYADSSMSHANNRFSTIPKTPDLVSHIHFQKEHTTLSMNTMISQVNIFGSNPQFYQGYNDPQRPKGSMMILREGWKRKYRVDIARYRDDGPGPMTQVFYWKGPMSPRAIFGSNNHNRTTSLGSSSTELKLVSADHPTQVLAVWKGGDGDGQQGNLTIFEGVGFAEGGILTEIITSCLVVTLFERNSLFGILDWLTK
jgi:hypothetical protein